MREPSSPPSGSHASFDPVAVRTSALRLLGGAAIAAIAASLTACVSSGGSDGARASEKLRAQEAIAGLIEKAPIEWKLAEPAARPPREQWWRLFQDAELDRLEELALKQNQQLAEILSRRDQAKALVGVGLSDRFPHLSATPAFTRQRTSPHAFDRGKEIGVPHTYTSYVLPLESSWELDLWGRVRRQVDAARARARAADDDYRAAKLSIQAEVATAYFGLAAAMRDQALLAATVEAYRKSSELVRERRRVGIVSDLDLAQAETQLRSAQSQTPASALRAQKLRNALAALCGATPAAFHSADSREASQLPGDIPSVVRSEWLENRPDIAAASRRVAAANADVGVARAAYYPRLALKGLAGVQSIDAASLLSWPSRIWAVGPSLDMPLFTAGRTRSLVAASRSAYDATVAQYRQTVLSAFQEVEDQLASLGSLAEQESAEVGALESSRKALEVANNRYRAGMITFLEVANAQTIALIHERAVVALRAERQLAAVGLIRALAASW
ncbi:MAG: efflux transporter outer membrane subunit [Verrucomicrobia bacterium]|nr:efflux transporter outer membrane subunit [Verrucomicrobiota bacterium]